VLAKDRQILAFGDLAIPSEHIEAQYPLLSLLHIQLINGLL